MTHSCTTRRSSDSHPLFHSHVRTFGFHIDHAIPWPGLAAWWHLVSNHYGDDLLRSKGRLRMQDAVRPFVFMQTVGKVFHRSEEHTSELQSLMRTSNSVFCLKKQTVNKCNSK